MNTRTYKVSSIHKNKENVPTTKIIMIMYLLDSMCGGPTDWSGQASG